jgi:hypothetical protein
MISYRSEKNDISIYIYISQVAPGPEAVFIAPSDNEDGCCNLYNHLYTCQLLHCAYGMGMASLYTGQLLHCAHGMGTGT